MRYVLIFITFFACSKWAQSQADIDKLRIGLSFAIEESDKRLFDEPDKDNVLARSPEIFGTYNYSLAATFRIFNKQKFSIRSGLGIGYELATFSRPIDQGYFYEIYPAIFILLDEYHKWMASIPFNFEISINNKVSIDLSIYNNLVVFKKINGAFSSLFPMTERKLSFDSSELLVGIPINVGKVNIKPYLRVFNIQKIDRAIFNYNIIGDPRVDKDIEFNNHFKFGVSADMLF